MAKISTKNYDKQVTELENMADGAKKHVSNPKVKATIPEDEFRGRKKTIEDLREKYNLLQADADKAYDSFSDEFKVNRKAISKATRLAKGIFGRSKPQLKDFGIKPEKK